MKQVMDIAYHNVPCTVPGSFMYSRNIKYLLSIRHDSEAREKKKSPENSPSGKCKDSAG